MVSTKKPLYTAIAESPLVILQHVKAAAFCVVLFSGFPHGSCFPWQGNGYFCSVVLSFFYPNAFVLVCLLLFYPLLFLFIEDLICRRFDLSLMAFLTEMIMQMFVSYLHCFVWNLIAFFKLLKKKITAILSTMMILSSTFTWRCVV